MKTDGQLTTQRLSRLFRLAVVAGVESAVRVHIERSDDLNARDDRGQTPLMLSAARNRAAICKLLVDAGADSGLLDPSGKDALSIALAAEAHDAAQVIEASRSCEANFRVDDRLEPAARGQIETLPRCPGFAIPLAHSPPVFEPYRVFASEPVFVDWTVELAKDDAIFDLTGWEAEADQLPPKGDPCLSTVAIEIQSTISNHQPIDTSANWDGFEVFLPEQASPLPRADDAEARERLRLVLLRAVREGSVPHASIEDLTLDDDGSPNDEAGALLCMVINDLGAETDERFEYSALHESFEVFVSPEEEQDEEGIVADAIAFIDDLGARRNEPLRIYQKEFQREALLTAEAEVALGQAMERGVENALDALASWPSGIGTVLGAAKLVMSGAKRLRWMSAGPRVEPQVLEAHPGADVGAASVLLAEGIGEDDERDSLFGLDAKESIDESDESAEFSAKADLLSRLAISPTQDTPEWSACRHALALLCLARSFLMELADSDLVGEIEPALAFEQAIKAYRRARDQMVVANLKLVFSIAKKYLFSGQPLDDLLQEGNIGLIKAVDRYDWRRGFKFSTYATWWIRQQVGRHVADKSKTIRLPAHVYEKTQRIAQSAHAFEVKNGRAPTVDEIAAMVDLPVRKVVSLARTALEPLPIHEIDVDDLIAMDAKDEFTARDPMDIVEDQQLIGAVDRFLGTLKLKEERVLRMHFGIGIQDSMTLEEIGARLDVTRERIRQIEAKAIRRLKHPFRLDRLLRELGDLQPTKRDETEDASNESDGKSASCPPTPTALAGVGVSPQPKPSAQASPRREPPQSGKPSAIDKLFTQAQSAGAAVHDERQSGGRIWVYITDTPDNHSRKLVRKLLALGFEFRPGKGYCK